MLQSVKNLWNKLAERAADAGEFVEQVARSGITFLRSSVGKIPLLTSTFADTAEPGLAIDETHYLLIPFRASECGYTLYTQRSLPPGVGPSNSLPKARVFHVHDIAGASLLEDLLVSSKKENRLARQSSKSDFADHLEQVGEQIDRESFKITSGLLIIGGAVAFANPIVGAGIAAKALFPSLGAKASRLGLSLAGKKLRDFSQRALDRRNERQTRHEVRKLKPELFVNPLLTQLERAVATPEPSHDPLLANPDLIDDFPNTRYLRVSLEGIVSVYRDLIENRVAASSLQLHEPDLAWFDHLRDLRETFAGS